MRVLYKILVFLLLSPVFLWAQIDWMGDISINKYFFVYEGDSLVVKVSVKKNGVTSQDPNPQTIRCKVRLSSSKYLQSHSSIQTSLETNMFFLERNEDRYIFSTSIPVNSLQKGRYLINIFSTDDNWNSYSSLDKFTLFPAPITVGNTGFVRVLSNFRINDDIFKFSILDFDNKFDLLPDKLSGTYSEGFCKDEIVDLNDIWFQIWSSKGNETFQLKSYYSIDGGEFIESDNSEKYDNSLDGKLEFDNLVINNDFYSNDEITDYSIKTDIDLKDILSLIDTKIHESHSIEMYFVLKTTNGEIRFPESGNIKTQLKVSNSPRGADCQAELLPIDLLSFDVIKSGKIVYIKWVTVSEINNDNFEIQRSTNAIDWETISVIKGKGETNSQNYYEYTDHYPIGGESYYRLKQNDFDGREKYSKVKVIYNFENKLTIYPNPASDYLSYNIRDINNDFDVLIYDNMGRIVKRFILPDSTNNNFKVDISYLKKGSYFIKYINMQNHQVEIKTFVKE